MLIVLEFSVLLCFFKFCCGVCIGCVVLVAWGVGLRAWFLVLVAWVGCFALRLVVCVGACCVGGLLFVCLLLLRWVLCSCLLTCEFVR